MINTQKQNLFENYEIRQITMTKTILKHITRPETIRYSI